MSNEYAKSREFIYLWDSTKANPNGDMLNDNKPRMDEITRLLEVSDFRVKRYVRDAWDLSGELVLVRTVFDNKGKVKTCAKRVSDIKEEIKAKTDDELVKHIMNNYIDARLFGCVLTSPKVNFLGPLQIMWSRSVNEGVIELKKGISAYASEEGRSASTNWESYICQYALFTTYMVYNKNTAMKNGFVISEDDIKKFKAGLFDGMKNFRSTSKNQMPRMLIEVIYKDNNLDGELDVVDIKSEVEDEELRSISQVSVDISKLNEYYKSKKDSIEAVNIYKHKNVEIDNLDKSLKFKIHDI